MPWTAGRRSQFDDEEREEGGAYRSCESKGRHPPTRESSVAAEALTHQQNTMAQIHTTSRRGGKP